MTRDQPATTEHKRALNPQDCWPEDSLTCDEPSRRHLPPRTLNLVDAILMLKVITHERAIGDLKRRTGVLERSPGDVIVPINTLAPEPFELARPVNIVVEPVIEESGRPSEFVATFVDASIGASGDTIEEAVSNLKDRLITTFEVLESMADRLGPHPRHQLEVLRAVMRRGGDGSP